MNPAHRAVGPAPVLEFDWPKPLDDVPDERFFVECNCLVGIPVAGPHIAPGEMGNAALLAKVRRL